MIWPFRSFAQESMNARYGQCPRTWPIGCGGRPQVTAWQDNHGNGSPSHVKKLDTAPHFLAGHRMKLDQGADVAGA
jgi:hypothetical protein